MGQPIVRYESGQTSYAFEEMTDSGDHLNYTASFSPLSMASGYSPTIAPYGLRTGGVIIPAVSATNDYIDVAACTVVAPGMTGADADGVVTVAADTDLAITRAVSTDTHMINSVTVDSSGAYAIVTGTDGTSFSETRGAAGGPPLIPVGSVEIGQVRTTSFTAAAITADEIFQVPGTHLERSDYPTWDVDYVNGEVDFVDALPTIHTGSVTKKVYIKGATPIFAPAPKSADWVPSDATYSISSTDTYDGPIGASSSSLGQATWTMILPNGVTENILNMKGETIWVEFRPDRDVTVPKQLTQGIFGISRTFPAGGGSVSASCTLTPSEATTDVVT